MNNKKHWKIFDFQYEQGWRSVFSQDKNQQQCEALLNTECSFNHLHKTSYLDWVPKSISLLLISSSSCSTSECRIVIFWGWDEGRREKRVKNIFVCSKLNLSDTTRLNFNIYYLKLYIKILKSGPQTIVNWWTSFSTFNSNGNKEWKGKWSEVSKDFDLLFSFYLLRRHEISVQWMWRVEGSLSPAAFSLQ